MKKRLSVLLPNFNNASYLKECLDCISDQTFVDFQVIFVDDCSSDNSLEIVDKHGDERIRVIRKEKNSGIVETLNVGIELIDTEYFIRLDGDDRMRCDRFEKLVEFMDDNSDVDICGSAIQTFGLREELQIYPSSSKVNKANLIFGHSIGHASCIFRTSTIKENKIAYQNDFYRLEDYQLFYTLKDIAKITSMNEPLYLYRQAAYNNNPDIEARKTEAYMSFYNGILNDLEVNSSPENIQKHLQLAGRIKPVFGLEKIDEYIALLLGANKGKRFFPQAELIQVLKRKREKLLYKLIDNGTLGKRELLKASIKNLGLLRYYASKQFKKE